jgi:hypothetical protein
MITCAMLRSLKLYLWMITMNTKTPEKRSRCHHLPNPRAFFRRKKKNTATRFTATISKDEVKRQSPKPPPHPKIAAKKSTDFKVDVECKLRNIIKQAAPHPKMIDFELGVYEDGTPHTGVLIKCDRGRNDKTCVLKEDINVVYLVDVATNKWCEGADMEKHNIRDMAGEVRCMFYMANSYQERTLEMFVKGKQLWFKVP